MNVMPKKSKKPTVSLYTPAEAPPQPAREAEGTRIELRPIRAETEELVKVSVRCRPGSFEWRYCRSSERHQLLAGSEFARAWERAGISITSPLTGDVKLGGGAWKGMPDGRAAALDQILRITRAIGGPITRRLVSYCVEGKTPREMASGYNGRVSPRQLADALDMDLIDLAEVMGYVSR